MLFRVLTHPKLGGSIGRAGLIIEPITLLRNQEKKVKLECRPPPRVVISYKKVYRGNGVYRVEAPEILSEMPDTSGHTPVLMANVPHLEDAIESLGLDKSASWAGYIDFGEDSFAKVVAWAI